MRLKIFENHPSFFVKKGEVLLKSGSRGGDAFYVVSGCLRSYITDSKGKEHIYLFAPEDWIISDLEFNKTRGSAILNIDAVEDSEVKRISISLFTTIPDSDRPLVEEALNKLHNRIYSLQKRVIELLSYSAEERYAEFIKTYPNLHSRVPLKMIASYLGVTPESLSRVRKELIRGK